MTPSRRMRDDLEPLQPTEGHTQRKTMTGAVSMKMTHWCVCSGSTNGSSACALSSVQTRFCLCCQFWSVTDRFFAQRDCPRMHCAERWLALLVSRLQRTSARTSAGRRWRTHVGFETAVANMGERCSRGVVGAHMRELMWQTGRGCSRQRLAQRIETDYAVSASLVSHVA